MQSKEIQSLSFIGILTRNLFLFSIMFIALGIGIAVHILDKQSLDCNILRIQSDRLSFFFLIIVAACYISLLFILIEKQWLNFVVQLLSSIGLFIFLLIVLNPILKVDVSIFSYDVDFSTRPWEKVRKNPISQVTTFTWLQMPDETDKLFPEGVACPEYHNVYFLNFAFTSNYNAPYDSYRDNNGKLGRVCNKKTKRLINSVTSREKAILDNDYEKFLQLDSNIFDTVWQQDKPLVIQFRQLPADLKERISKNTEITGDSLNKLWLKPSMIRAAINKQD